VADYGVRQATPEDLTLIEPIERAAGQLFAEAGMQDIADHPPTPLGHLTTYIEHGILLLATERDRVVGFAGVVITNDHAHLDQMAVDPANGRQGHGTRLIEAVCSQLQARGCTHLTLTTFEHLDWNAPYYAKRGFRILDPDEITSELQALRAEEASYGLDPTKRVVMRRDLPPARTEE
jgi:GNAT superfamily N-acetyltransferase